MTKVIVEKATEEKLKELNVYSWGKWEKEVSEFEWEYDANERAYIIEGSVTVRTDEGDVEINKGDLVFFPKGLKCKWIVKSPIKKHYTFE